MLNVLFLLSFLCAGASERARALGLLSNVFGSHMTLQRDAPIPVWGWTTPGGAVRATLGAQVLMGVGDAASGLWRVEFSALPAWANVTLSALELGAGGARVELDDIIAGDVVLCSGQSNMEFTTNAAVNASAELAAADAYPFIRVTSGPLQGLLDLRTLPAGVPSEELVAVDLPWSRASNASIGGAGDHGGWDYFSAACWFSLKGLADANAAAGAPVPLGGIVQSYGGTSIQWWSPPGALAQCAAFDAPGRLERCEPGASEADTSPVDVARLGNVLADAE
jgi:sialate O-acetylesterase